MGTTFPQMIQDPTQRITQNKSTMNYITWSVFLGVLQSSEALNCYSCPRGGLDCQNGPSQETLCPYEARFCLKVDDFEGNLIAQKCFDPRSDSQRWGPMTEDECQEQNTVIPGRTGQSTVSVCTCRSDLCNSATSTVPQRLPVFLLTVLFMAILHSF